MLRQEIAELSLRCDPLEHVLYPEKCGLTGTAIWENRRKPLSGPALHRWWYRCLPVPGSLTKAASQALGHSDLSTTLGIYGHQDQCDLERAMEALARMREAGLINDES